MYDPVEDASVLLSRGIGAENTITENDAVQVAVCEEEVGGAGAEVGCYCGVAFGAGLDDLARDEVGIDYGEVVGRGREDGRYGGFACRDGAGEANNEHIFFFWWSGRGGGGRGGVRLRWKTGGNPSPEHILFLKE